MLLPPGYIKGSWSPRGFALGLGRHSTCRRGPGLGRKRVWGRGLRSELNSVLCISHLTALSLRVLIPTRGVDLEQVRTALPPYWAAVRAHVVVDRMSLPTRNSSRNADE